MMGGTENSIQCIFRRVNNEACVVNCSYKHGPALYPRPGDYWVTWVSLVGVLDHGDD